MPFVLKQECPDCRKYNMTGDMFHSKQNWDRHHHAGWINGKSDWKPRSEIKEELEQAKKVWMMVKDLYENSDQI